LDLITIFFYILYYIYILKKIIKSDKIEYLEMFIKVSIFRIKLNICNPRGLSHYNSTDDVNMFPVTFNQNGEIKSKMQGENQRKL